MALITPIDLCGAEAIAPVDDGIALPWGEIARCSELGVLLALVRASFGTSMAFISILGRDYQWFMAADGIEPAVTLRQDSVCQSVVYDRGLAWIGDLAADPELAGNRFVAAEGGLRGYAGVRMRLESGNGCTHPVAVDHGAFCVADTAPRIFDDAEIDRLHKFSNIAKALVRAHIAEAQHHQLAADHRLLTADRARKERLFRQTERMTEMGSWRMDMVTQAIEWSPGVYAIHALSEGSAPPLDDAMRFYSPTDQAILSGAIGECSLIGTPFDLELDFTAADGARKRVRAVGECERSEGRPVALIGMFQDVTARYRVETVLRDQAFADPLTNIANRAALQQHLADVFADAPRAGFVSALVIDLDGFKTVNDRLGHVSGDEILCKVAAVLQREVVDGSLITRYGGDEFVVVVTGKHSAIRASGYAHTLSHALRFDIAMADGTVSVGASVGTATNQAGDGPTSLLRRADDAMYRRKSRSSR